MRRNLIFLVGGVVLQLLVGFGGLRAAAEVRRIYYQTGFEVSVADPDGSNPVLIGTGLGYSSLRILKRSLLLC